MIESTHRDHEAVEANINYLTKSSLVNRRYVAAGEEFNTGDYEPRLVKIRNARNCQEQFTLDSHGFTLLAHKSNVDDFTDSASVDAIYPDEVVAAVAGLTGADLVVPLGWMLRTSGDIPKQEEVAGYQHQGGLQPPAGDVHVDMLPDRAEGIAEAIYKKVAPDGTPYRRFIAMSVWRAFSPPPQDWPLAVCDGRSVEPSEGVANTMIVCDALPDEATMLAPLAGEEEMMAAAVFRFNPAHRWWYFPDMTRDELLLFKFHDSEKSVATRSPHTAFHDMSCDNPNERKSIEFRVIAYFL